MTVGVTGLVPSAEATEQLDLFDIFSPQEGTKNRERQDKVEAAVDALRQKMWNLSVTLGVQQNEAIGIKREWKKWTFLYPTECV